MNHKPQAKLATTPIKPIPVSIFLNHLAVLGKTGSGKTYTSKGFVEGMLDRKERVCIIDPTNVWWGLRSKADGKSAAYPVVVFGGDKADMPLMSNAGAAMAEIVGTTDINAVLVTKHMTVGERTRFFTDFAEGLMRANRGPLNLVIDEAHNFMPQGKVISPQAGAMLAAGNELLSGGRACGLRITIISQRPQKLHKDALTQAESLIALRLVAPHDRKAVAEWMAAQAEDESHAKAILNSLPGLRTGEGWVWAPSEAFLQKTAFPRISTYDSSAAPTGKENKVVLAKVDLPAIEQKLGSIAKDMQSNDPKWLKAQIAELQKALGGRTGQSEAKTDIIVKLEAEKKKAYDAGYAEGMSEAIEQTLKQLEFISGGVLSLATEANNLSSNILDIHKKLKGGQKFLNRGSKSKVTFMAKKETDFAPVPVASAMVTGRIQTQKPNFSQPPRTEGGNSSLGLAQRKILTALAQDKNGEGISKKKVAVLSGYSVGGGSFNNALSQLNTSGLIEKKPGADLVRITQEGLNALGDYTPLPRGYALLQHWMNNNLGKAEREILQALYIEFEAGRGMCSKERLGQITGYEASGGSFNNALSKLRTLELISGSRDLLISNDFFE